MAACRLHVRLYFGTGVTSVSWFWGARGWAGVLWARSHCSALWTFLCSARVLEKARQQLQEEVRQVSSQLLEERKKREMQEALARRLQKRVLLLTKVRGMAGVPGLTPLGVPAVPASSRQPIPATSSRSVWYPGNPWLSGSLPDEGHF